MNPSIALCFCVSATLAIGSAAAQTPTESPVAAPYAGQQHRSIKAYSDDEVQNYLAGKGMGMAKAAELNGFPGPLHVLALASELKLSQEQVHKTQALFDAMDAQARAAGQRWMDEERRLDRAFMDKSISPQGLQAALERIGRFQTEVRQAHLAAHLAQIRILSPEQVSAYQRLRGYDEAPGQLHQGAPASHGHHRH